MSFIKTFEIKGESYNVVRASAVQQDEILSMLTSPIVERLSAIASETKGAVADESLIFNFLTAIPFHVKQKLDELLLSRFTKSGSEVSLSIRDFDGKLLELGQLRAKVLFWNLEPFFEYWASEIKSALAEKQKTESQTQ